jgi:hypothetical protein
MDLPQPLAQVPVCQLHMFEVLEWRDLFLLGFFGGVEVEFGLRVKLVYVEACECDIRNSLFDNDVERKRLLV